MNRFVGVADQSDGPPAGRRFESHDGVGSKHAVAVAKTLRYAVDAAAGGDYPDALAWLATVEAIGDVLPQEYETKRTVWQLAARAHA
jgi:hypothetical protein